MVIHHHNIEQVAGILLCQQCFNTSTDAHGFVPGRNDHRDAELRICNELSRTNAPEVICCAQEEESVE